MVYKFLHTDIPGYFAPFFKPKSSAYKTGSSTTNSSFLNIPQYIPPQINQTLASLVFMLLRFWMTCLLTIALFGKAYPLQSPYPGCSPWCRPGYFPDSWFWIKLFVLSTLESVLQRLNAIKIILELLYLILGSGYTEILGKRLVTSNQQSPTSKNSHRVFPKTGDVTNFYFWLPLPGFQTCCETELVIVLLTL